MDSELKKTLQHTAVQHAAVQQTPVHHAGIHHAGIHHAGIHHAGIHHAGIHHAGIHHAGIDHGVGQHTVAGYKSNQQRKCTRMQRDIKQATSSRIQYWSVTWRTLSDTVTVLEKKCESREYRMSALETKAQQSRETPLADDETEDTISDCESYFKFINPENENDNENKQSGQDYAKSCSSKDSSTSSHKERKLSDTFEERLFKNDARVTQIKARIAELLGDIDDVVREMKEAHEDITISSQQRFHGETIAPGVARIPAYEKFEGPAGVAGNHSG